MRLPGRSCFRGYACAKRPLTWRPIDRYPHLIFYAEAAEHIDVWRVLHGQQDLPALMRTIDTL